MKLIVVGRPQTYLENREFEAFLTRIEKEIGEIRKMSAISRDGVALVELYGIMQIPALLVTRDDGSVVGMWEGERPEFEIISAAYHS